jgi:hypothetical protein
MTVATLVGVFFIPVFYVLMQRLSERKWPFRRSEPTVPPGGGSPAADAVPSPAAGDD